MASDRRDWPRQTWRYPLHHNYTFGFGLDMDDAASSKHSTIVPYAFQDNAIVDYETVKVNPENEDFTTRSEPNCAAGSYVPRITVMWQAWAPSTEVDVLQFRTMKINIAMLNRLDAFDKKTGNDIETLLELTHETTDEQTLVLWNATKLYEGHGVNDYHANVAGLTGTQQPEGVAFDIEMFFDAMHYYTNKQMLRAVTQPMKKHFINGALSTDRRQFEKVVNTYSNSMPSICKYMHPYTFFGELFHLNASGSQQQFANIGDTTAVEHLTVIGHVRFNEYNPDWNFARA